MSNVYQIKDVAKMLSVSESSVNKLIKTGQLESFHVGQKCVRIGREALAYYIAASGGGNVFPDVDLQGPALEKRRKEIAAIQAKLREEAEVAKAERKAKEAQDAKEGKVPAKKGKK